MKVSCFVDIKATPEVIWNVITDIDNCAQWMGGIIGVEVLQIATGPSVVGLKWRETREWMGKEAVEVMWVTDAVDGQFYQTQAESHGSVYRSRLELQERTDTTRVTMTFDGSAITVGAKIIWALTGWMAKRALNKTMAIDLADIRKESERRTSQ